MAAPRYLIIGASGLIGSRLLGMLGPEKSMGTYHRNPVPNSMQFDVTRTRLADSILPKLPSLTHAFILPNAGSLDACARDPEGTGKVNVEGACRMIDDLSAAGIRTLFASSDAVWDGTRGAWTEEDKPAPKLTYGAQKARVEEYLAAVSVSWTVARLSKVVAGSFGPHGLLGDWVRQIEAGETIRCADDLIFTPIEVDDAAEAMLHIADAPESGIFNVCGPRSMSRMELLLMLAAEMEKYGKYSPKIERCGINDFPFLEKRPLNQSMLDAKLRNTWGRSAHTMEAVCSRVVFDHFSKQGVGAKRSALG